MTSSRACSGWLLVAWVVACVALAGCGSGGSSAPDGDLDSEATSEDSDSNADGDSDGDADSSLLGFGEVCTSNRQCASLLCINFGSYGICSRTCSDDATCTAEKAGASCTQLSGGSQNVCFYDPSAGDDDSETAACSDSEKRCSGNYWVQSCKDGAWTADHQCGTTNENEICLTATAECGIPGADSDDSDSDSEVCTAEGKQIPNDIKRYAKEFFNTQAQSESHPKENAMLMTSDNPEFLGVPFVGLIFTELDSATQKNGELVFTFSVDGEGLYPYFFDIDFVCGQAGWGRAALYIDDDKDPVKLTAADTGLSGEQVELFCPARSDISDGKSAYPNYLVRGITFTNMAGKCLANGEHKMRIRTVGYDGNSMGYSIGVDYIHIAPFVSAR